MTVKKVHLYNMAWHELRQLCREQGRPATAGEFAIQMGIARSTAQRWLTDMEGESAVVAYREIGKNGLPKRTYAPIAEGSDWYYGTGGN